MVGSTPASSPVILERLTRDVVKAGLAALPGLFRAQA
jgi:hypothetical protein